MTIDEIFRAARQQCRYLYSEQEINAMVRVLLQHYINLTSTQLYTEPDFQFSIANAQLLTDALHQLSTGRPLQYITGKTEFCGLPFEVNEQVLIPRPETEELVRWAVEELKAYAEPVVLDLCTGSGCIAIAVAKQCPTAKVLACDISAEALAVAQRNAERNNVAVEFFQCDILDSSKFKTHHSSLIILSNPPYVRNSEKALMRKNVLDHEPHTALFVDDEDPLVFYRAIAAIAKQYMQSDSFVMVEINEALATETTQVFRDAGFTSLELRQDINGKDRTVKINKKACCRKSIA
ncbi:MAG: peptide chain release factor N(5)-glutamine methyltransferase [Bacteroidales bacterium]|nr:peptide chain release factor N(5)-glutamine methyltransferase [Bacteroidales bacterium]MCL2133543.1 peptide chain release factor N(5)-glutamine methyltransferase [Bacteroidales bacterium]